MDGNSFFSFDFLLSRINPLLSWALHASFYAKHHIKEEQRMGRALRMRDEGRSWFARTSTVPVCFPPVCHSGFQRHQRKLSTIPVPIFIPLPSGATDTQYCQILNERTPSRIDKAGRRTERPFGDY